MRRLAWGCAAALTAVMAVTSLGSCSDDESYAEMKKKEKRNIQAFIRNNDVVGPIEEIDEAKFLEQDSVTDTLRNQFVRFDDDGIYMQIVRRGNGRSVVEMAKERADSTVNFTLLCRFVEYAIEGADTTEWSGRAPSIVDKLTCSYAHRGRSYTGSFYEGLMLNKYSSAVVPKAWLKPLDYIRLSRKDNDIAKVRLIVPSTSGTANASTYVLPYYYEITYQLGL